LEAKLPAERDRVLGEIEDFDDALGRRIGRVRQVNAEQNNESGDDDPEDLSHRFAPVKDLELGFELLKMIWQNRVHEASRLGGDARWPRIPGRSKTISCSWQRRFWLGGL